ncbi:hypothetical protein [Pseudomonas deceptionensis]|uniref:hypothetical protein n=1 Tax=Pseudomonas deceptionensis TaxID=882211 RepID=UPI0006547968|nr:hypothetical protein [Pseudomonas deceptionensis]
MFRTMREAELMPNIFRAANGFQFWSLVELETMWPWFHVETIDSRSNGIHQGVVLAPSVPLLVDLIGGQSKTAWINQVQVVTPGEINGTGSWRMEALVSLHELVDSAGQIVGHAYQVATGTEYSTVADYDQHRRNLLYAPKASDF